MARVQWDQSGEQLEPLPNASASFSPSSCPAAKAAHPVSRCPGCTRLTPPLLGWRHVRRMNTCMCPAATAPRWRWLPRRGTPRRWRRCAAAAPTWTWPRCATRVRSMTAGVLLWWQRRTVMPKRACLPCWAVAGCPHAAPPTHVSAAMLLCSVGIQPRGSGGAAQMRAAHPAATQPRQQLCRVQPQL